MSLIVEYIGIANPQQRGKLNKPITSQYIILHDRLVKYWQFNNFSNALLRSFVNQFTKRAFEIYEFLVLAIRAWVQLQIIPLYIIPSITYYWYL